MLFSFNRIGSKRTVPEGSFAYSYYLVGLWVSFLLLSQAFSISAAWPQNLKSVSKYAIFCPIIDTCVNHWGISATKQKILRPLRCILCALALKHCFLKGQKISEANELPKTEQNHFAKGHSFCKQCLHDLQFKKTRYSSPDLSELARDGISCQFKKTRQLCRHCLQKKWTLYIQWENKERFVFGKNENKIICF